MNPDVQHNHPAHAALVLERLRGAPVFSELKPLIAALRAAYARHDEASRNVWQARMARDVALDALGNADAEVDATLQLLAFALVDAGVGTAAQPFKGRSTKSLVQLAALDHHGKPAEVARLAARVAKAEPRPTIVKLCKAALARAKKLARAATATTTASARLLKAIAVREALLPELAKAIRALSARAATTWTAATHARVFAPRAGKAARKPKAGGERAKANQRGALAEIDRGWE